VEVTSIKDSVAVVEHNGTVPIWDLRSPDELRDATEGGFLELICEMHIVAGGLMGAHSHPTHEYYYVIEGAGHMRVDDETREVRAGDLVYIPPDAVHSLQPTDEQGTMRVFAFAIGLPGAPRAERERN
jgi:quercetin dioxygenase-like cupin family protein